MVFPGTFVYRRGAPVREILEIIRFNSRSLDIVLGDLDAQIAAIRTGQRRIAGLLLKFGADRIDAAIGRILSHGEAAARRALAEIPEGQWSASDFLDDDGITDDPVPMKVTVTHRGGRFGIDFAGSPRCVAGPVNLPFGSTLATCKVAFKALTTPGEPSNGGHMRPLHVHAEPGTLFHATYPAATFTQWTGIVALELIFKALAEAMADRLPASSGGDVPGFMMIGVHPDTGANYAISNNDAIGWGATICHDGADTRNHPCQSIVRNTPVQIMETRTPMFFERVEIIPDTGGAGRYRGGPAPRYSLPGGRRIPDRHEKNQNSALGAAGRSYPGSHAVDPFSRHSARAFRRNRPDTCRRGRQGVHSYRWWWRFRRTARPFGCKYRRGYQGWLCYGGGRGRGL